MRIMVTGAAGRVGRSLCEALHQKGHEILAVYSKSLPDPTTVSTSLSYECLGDAAVRTKVGRLDCLVHLAWTESKGADDGADNLEKFNKILEHCKLWSPRSILLLSCSGVGGPGAAFDGREGRTELAQPGLAGHQKGLLTGSSYGSSPSPNASSSFPSHQALASKTAKYLLESALVNSPLSASKCIVRSGAIKEGLLEQAAFERAMAKLLWLPWIYPLPHFDQKIMSIGIESLVAFLLQKIEQTGQGGRGAGSGPKSSKEKGQDPHLLELKQGSGSYELFDSSVEICQAPSEGSVEPESLIRLAASHRGKKLALGGILGRAVYRVMRGLGASDAKKDLGEFFQLFYKGS